MTGTIKMLRAGNPAGLISAENGASLYFDTSAMAASDAASLAVGQPVTFDLERGGFPKAIHVCVQKPGPVPALSQDGHSPIYYLRYMGFEQNQSTRAYRFERFSPGQPTIAFIVDTDLALLAKHHVSLQEGPALCRHLLLAELDAAGDAGRPALQRSLTDQDMLAHLASRPGPQLKNRTRRASHAATLPTK